MCMYIYRSIIVYITIKLILSFTVLLSLAVVLLRFSDFLCMYEKHGQPARLMRPSFAFPI